MNYYISDLHFGHENVISLCNRPFCNVQQMNESLIEKWNKVVHKNDNVFILGDFAYNSNVNVEDYLSQLKGEKHLLIGNHDKSYMSKINMFKYFKTVDYMSIINTGKGKATLCHYPLLDFKGKFMIHGHIHAKAKKLKYWDYLKNSNAYLNAGVDVNNYTPVSLEELINNNELFKRNNI